MEPRAGGQTREEIRFTVISALMSARARQPGVPEIVDEQTAIGSAGLGISSLNMLQALVRIEDGLSIVFDDRAVADAPLLSVGAVVDLVERALAAKGE